jgi:solute carrier family 25 carnitine/acylcarnitine transporter 20/29
VDDYPPLWWHRRCSDLGLRISIRYFDGLLSPIITDADSRILDVIKTRVQTQGISRSPVGLLSREQSELLPSQEARRLGTIQIAKQAYREEGLSVFFRGLGVCSIRAFFVNAVQWAVYEWMMHILLPSKAGSNQNKHDQMI